MISWLGRWSRGQGGGGRGVAQVSLKKSWGGEEEVGGGGGTNESVSSLTQSRCLATMIYVLANSNYHI